MNCSEIKYFAFKHLRCRRNGPDCQWNLISGFKIPIADIFLWALPVLTFFRFLA